MVRSPSLRQGASGVSPSPKPEKKPLKGRAKRNKLKPRNFEESTKIAKEGKSKYNYGIWWLGVNDINEEGKLVFDSDGAPVPFTPTWYGGNDDYQDCVLVYHSTSDPKWQIISCSNRVSMGTLCEYGE